MFCAADGSSHGVLLMSSNGMDVVLDKDTLSWRIIGGMVDLYILMGPTPGAVLEQLTRLIGRPALPPYWSLGFHQCKSASASVPNMCWYPSVWMCCVHSAVRTILFVPQIVMASSSSHCTPAEQRQLPFDHCIAES